MVSPKSKVTIGKLGAPYGVHGWVKLNSFAEPPENILLYTPWLINVNSLWQPCQVEDQKWVGANLVVKIAGCEDRDAAKRYTNAEIAVLREQLPDLMLGEQYWADLVGLTVINTDKVTLGVVDHLIATGSNDVLVVKGEKEHLIPYTDDVIVHINEYEQVITVNWDANE